MVIVPRASTHLEYTDIPLVMPASRYGQALTSVYVQRWLGRYLKHEGVSAKPTGTDPLLATSFRYLEPTGNGVWKPITLKRRRRPELLLLLGVRHHRPQRQDQAVQRRHRQGRRLHELVPDSARTGGWQDEP